MTGQTLRSWAAWIRRAIVVLLVAVIRLYQSFISPLTPPSCRYYPSCSAYAVTALQSHGPAKGSWLAVRRLARCHPWAAGGVDHVPPAHPHGHLAHDH